MTLRLGIDLGGSKIEIIALAADGNELLRARVATPQGNYDATVDAICALVGNAEQRLGKKGTLGIGIPGAESRATGLIKNANSTCLIGRPLRDDLQTRLQREVRIANDANCFALSEATDGTGAGAAVVFGVILGTGVGGGIVVNGQVLAGANAIAGEWGHNYLAPDRLSSENERSGRVRRGVSASGLALEAGSDGAEPVCYCGRTACVEAWLSGPALAEEHFRIAYLSSPGMEFDHTKVAAEKLDSRSIVARAGAGDAACEATLRRYEARLARALSQVINILDPEVIVLGGGLSNIDRLFENVPKLWGEFVFSDYVATRLLKNRHGDSSGVRGAAWLWDRQE